MINANLVNLSKIRPDMPYSSQSPARLMLADDHEVVRSGLRNALQDMTEIKIVGEVGNGLALKSQLLSSKPDCLLIDITMPDFEPISDIKQIRKMYPAMRILVVSAHDDDVYVQGLLGIGVNGYHLKDQPLSDLRLAVQRVLSGQRWVSSRLLDKLVAVPGNQQKPAFELTRRQKDVLGQLQQGFDNQTIARNSGLSVKTIENHLTRIYRQLGVQSRLEAVNFLMNNPLLLAQSKSSAENDSPASTSQLPNQSAAKQQIVLVVDDNQRYRSQLRKTIQSLLPDGKILEAANISEAVTATSTHRPQLAFVDVVLGSESGIECTQALTKLQNPPRILLITAYPDQEFRRTGREAGAAALLDKKDINIEVLRQIVGDI